MNKCFAKGISLFTLCLVSLYVTAYATGHNASGTTEVASWQESQQVNFDPPEAAPIANKEQPELINQQESTGTHQVKKPIVPDVIGNQSFVDAENRFAMSLTKSLASKQTTNFVVSPYGVFECLNILKSAGSPTVDIELSKILGLQPSQVYASDMLNLNQSFNVHFTQDSSTNGLAEGEDPGIPAKLFVSETVLIQDNRIMLADYAREQIFQPFRAEFVSFDREAAGGAEQAAQMVNQIFSNATAGRLSGISYSPPSKDTVFSIVNLCFFDGQWTKPFMVGSTTEGEFTTGTSTGGTLETTTAMFMTDDSRRAFFFENERIKLVELPYQNSTLSMVLVLPNPDVSMTEAMAAIVESKCLGNRSESPRVIESVAIRVPKFSFQTSDIDLKTACQSLGISKVFTKDANFERLFNVKTSIVLGSALQNAFIEVNEEGTKAAAITEFNMLPMAASPVAKKEFFADRPFLFFVSDSKGAILFSGQVVDPNGGEK